MQTNDIIEGVRTRKGLSPIKVKFKIKKKSY